MIFKVCCFPDTPDFETLHAAKLTDFPLEKRDYKPFSQVRICFSQDGLHVQFHCFETESLPQSAMHAYLLWSSGCLLQLSIFANGDFVMLSDETAITHGEFVHFTGEDLQGVYWGGTFTIPAEFFIEKLSVVPKIGESFRGNFYKVCTSLEKPHYGSYFPADFSLAMYAPENLGEFLLISY